MLVLTDIHNQTLHNFTEHNLEFSTLNNVENRIIIQFLAVHQANANLLIFLRSKFISKDIDRYITWQEAGVTLNIIVTS